MENDQLRFIIEIHAPDIVVGAIENADMRDVSNVAQIEVMLYSGDAARNGEYFNVFTDVVEVVFNGKFGEAFAL